MFEGAGKKISEKLENLSTPKKAGVIGAAVATVLGLAELTNLGIAKATEIHEKITVASKEPEANRGNLWGLKLGGGETLTDATGKSFDDHPAVSLGKWKPLDLQVGETYDITYYTIPGNLPNIRSATPVDEEK